ncbi:MAG TPA: hypothetical protein VFH51_14175 [Myxococcota bacterium]|nr:hypothetical protein [Myxococcota bacterium]
MRLSPASRLAVIVLLALSACTGDKKGPGNTAEPYRLFVAHQGDVTSFDYETGEELPGSVQQAHGPTDLQVLADGTVLVNLTDHGQILIVDGKTMNVVRRPESSTLGAVRPVHSYLTPERNGRAYWLTLNDGTGNRVETNSVRFVDVHPGSATYLQPVGEVGLGVGHHKAAFSTSVERAVITNIADCNNVLSVYDYSDVTAIKALMTIGSAELGWDGSSFPKTCDPTYQAGVPPAPHGCGTSAQSHKTYCNVTASGELVAVDLDATPPAFARITTHGKGGGYTKAHPGGAFIYSLQGEPREGKGGAPCQIGQLVVLDAATDKVALELPLLYEGPACTRALVGTDEETTEPSHMLVSEDGKTLFVTAAGGFGVPTARVRQHLVVDISNPTAAQQQPSIAIGTSTSYHGDALTGDGKYLFVANNQDATVSQIDTASRTVVKTLRVHDAPQTLGTYHSSTGPSEQTGPIP